MTSRRNFLVAVSALSAAAVLSDAAAAAGVEMGDFLFVQTADAMRFDAATSTLTLQGVSKTTLFFSDRPERIAGNMKTEAFVPFWSTGKDSFLSDPPNADLSFIDGQTLRQVVVILRNPVLDGDALSYSVEIIDGEMPDSGSFVSLFIDIIGMPLTPLSFAGAARRSYRRAFLY